MGELPPFIRPPPPKLNFFQRLGQHWPFSAFASKATFVDISTRKRFVDAAKVAQTSAAGMIQVSHTGFAYPDIKLAYHEMHWLALMVPHLRTTFLWTKKLTFRRGIEARAKPDHTENNTEIEDAKVLIEQANSTYDQSLMKVLWQFEGDMLTTDNGWLSVSREWPNARVKKPEPDAAKLGTLYHQPSALMRWSMNKARELGKAWKRCPLCVDQVQRYTDRRQKCRCGATMVPVVAIRLKAEGGDDIAHYFVGGEVYHDSRLDGGQNNILYGSSGVETLAIKAQTLYNYDHYRWDSLNNKTLPDGVLVFKSSNPRTGEDVGDKWRMQSRAAKEKGERHRPMVTTSAEKGAGLEYVSLLSSIFTDLPDIQAELKRDIAALYGIPSAFYNDFLQTGGLNSEAFQGDIAKIPTDWNQSQYIDGVFPWLAHVFQWEHTEIGFPMPETQLEQLRLGLECAQMVLNMGGTAEIRAGEVIIPDQELEKGAAPSPFPTTESGVPRITPMANDDDQQLFDENGKDATKSHAIKFEGEARRDAITKQLAERIYSLLGPELTAAKQEVLRMASPTIDSVLEVYGKHFDKYAAAMLQDQLLIDLYTQAYVMGKQIAQRDDPELMINWEGVNDEAKDQFMSSRDTIYGLLSSNLWTNREKQKILSFLTDAFTDQGISKEILIQNIKGYTGRARYYAERIARTEIHRAVDDAKVKAYQNSRYADAQFDWLTAGDSRVRPEHAEWMRDGPYSIGEIEGMMANRGINCRCTVVRRGRLYGRR